MIRRRPLPAVVRARFAAVLGGLVLAAAAVAAAKASGAAPGADARAVVAILETYRTAWLAGDATAVRSLFVDDAVFLPHHGLPPIEGLAALSAFWWPAGGSKVDIVRFELEARRVEVAGDLAYAWGRQALEWTQEDPGGTKRTRTRGNHLTILRRTGSGWKIELQMADDEPNERL